MKSGKKLLALAMTALLAVLCLSCGRGFFRSCARTEPAAEETPSAPAVTETPHEHCYDPETGVCSVCGEACAHEAGYDGELRCCVCGKRCAHERGFTENGCCVDCGWQCPHERHDPDTAVCPVCGTQRNHHFGIDGICDSCGAKAPLVTEALPDLYLQPAVHQGQHFRETVVSPSGEEHSLAIWLPYDYNENTRYNVAIMIHGDRGEAGNWTDMDLSTERGDLQFRTIYDHLVEQHLCDPFIVVGVNNGVMKDQAAGVSLIKDTVLPHLARSYSTYMDSDRYEDIAAAREHIAIGGLSRGSVYTYFIGMMGCLDVSANFCCFSNGWLPYLPSSLNAADKLDYSILSYVATAGLKDNRETYELHMANYENLCNRVERITDGENARFFSMNEGHNFLMWTASFYNSLLLMF